MNRWKTSDGHWLAGLADGEGCFYFQLRTKQSRRYPGKIFRNVCFQFKIDLRSDDELTLKHVREILGVGRMFSSDRENRRCIDPLTGKQHQGKPISGFYVGNTEELKTVVSFFTTFPLRSKKARHFDVWKKAFQVYVKAFENTHRKASRKGVLDRPSSVKRRPLASTKPNRFYAIPDKTWAAMQVFKDQLNETRKYKDPEIVPESYVHFRPGRESYPPGCIMSKSRSRTGV
jgi:hypothetical protein